MTRTEWRLLSWIAGHLPWTWNHLVTARQRSTWAMIGLAMTARTWHAPDWSNADPAEGPTVTIPAWVPCPACGGRPCEREPSPDALHPDPRTAALEAALGRTSAPWDDHGPGYTS